MWRSMTTGSRGKFLRADFLGFARVGLYAHGGRRGLRSSARFSDEQL